MNQAIVIKPIITEKSSQMSADNKYVFKISSYANKIMVAKAVEDVFNVKVASVHTINMKAKKKRLGKFAGEKAAWKKAIVTLKDGFKIDKFEKLS